LRLRDLGGVIICDFIDLRYERNRRELYNRLNEHFANDRAKSKVLPMSQFGIVEITRQRMRPSLKRSIYSDCPHCKGAGLVKTPESMGLDVMRRLAMAAHDARVARVELTVCSDVEFYLQNKKRAHLVALETETGKQIVIKSDPRVGLDEVKLTLFDARDGLVFVAELGITPPTELGAKPEPGRRDNRGRDSQRNDARRPPNRTPPPSQRRDAEDHDIDSVEDEVDRRESEMEDGEPSVDLVVAPPPPTREIVAKAQPTKSDKTSGDGDSGPDPRRRRRRGRRGRGRGRQDFVNQDSPNQPSDMAPVIGDERPDLGEDIADHDPRESVDLDLVAARVEPTVENELEQPDSELSEPAARAESDDEGGDNVRRRRRRGGRRHRKNRDDSAPRQDGKVVQSHPRPPAPPQLPGPPEPRAAEAQTLTRTGSADRHLVSDEPVAPQPVSRPRSFRDLDSIPDDYD
jgi:hypothetical protein